MYAIFKHMYNTEFEIEEAKQTDGVQTSINLLRTDREKTWRRCWVPPFLLPQTAVYFTNGAPRNRYTSLSTKQSVVWECVSISKQKASWSEVSMKTWCSLKLLRLSFLSHEKISVLKQCVNKQYPGHHTRWKCE